MIALKSVCIKYVKDKTIIFECHSGKMSAFNIFGIYTALKLLFHTYKINFKSQHVTLLSRVVSKINQFTYIHPAYFRSAFRNIMTLVLFFLLPLVTHAQTIAVKSGSFIVNMGVIPQKVSNGLKPYGMIYDLIKNHNVSVVWSVNPAKVKDGIDFSHNGIDYRGGPFIIPVEFRTAAVNSRITFWQSQGVVGATTVSNITVPIDPIKGVLANVPRWTLDKTNGQIAAEYFSLAGIPASAHGGSTTIGWKYPSELTCCDDIFVMPHADPIWTTHNNLFVWNQVCKGAIWNACHSGSAIENIVNPNDRNVQMNFLTTKDPAFTGTSGNYANSNSLILWGDHGRPSAPFTYQHHTDYVSQFIGFVDGSVRGGSEKIFVPRQSAGTTAGWRPTTKVLVYDPTQEDVPVLQGDLRNVAAIMAYGRGFGDSNRGLVMHTAGHELNSRINEPDHIAGMRTFFNFSWIVAMDRAEVVTIVNAGGTSVYGGQAINLSFNFPDGDISQFSIQWSSTCGGTFSNGGTTQTVQYTPPSTTGPVDCIVTVSITDGCGRTTLISQNLAILCDYAVSHTKITPICNGSTNGSITLNISGNSSTGANTWNWSRVTPAGTGSGTTASITDLRSGTYNITVTSAGGCSATFTTSLSEPSAVSISPTVTNYQCFGQTGAIQLSVAGGTSPYAYLWNGGATTQNRVEINAGTYTVTVTDNKNCTASAVRTVTGQTSSFTVSASKSDITCAGLNNGTINLTLSGTGYTYLWNGGSTSKDRTSLSQGTHSVTVTDSDGCTNMATATILQPLPLSISVATIRPTCPPGGTPPGNADGSITLTVSGGTPAYTYLWNGGITTQNRTGLQAGSYTVTFTDSKGCPATSNVTLTAINNLPGLPSALIR